MIFSGWLCTDAVMQDRRSYCTYTIKMTHEYNTRRKKDIDVTTDSVKSLEDNIISDINSLSLIKINQRKQSSAL